MKNFILTVISILISVGITGCNSISAPSDKTIIDTSISKALSSSVTLTNFKIIEKGNRLSNGRYPVKLQYEMILDGRVIQMEGIKYFYQGQDSMGKSIWMVSNSPS